MFSYYRRIIPSSLAVAKPLIRLTKKFANFDWTKECQAVFDFIKESLTIVPVLSYPYPSKPHILYTDASVDCIGTCLLQEQYTQGG